MKPYDIIIIGGGIVGTATAYALAKRKIRLAIIEAEDHLAAHQTGNNSGVIHSGLYYKPGSLKARNSVKGREALYTFCEQHNIAHDRCGKLVVATHQKEIPLLKNLKERGIANGLNELKDLGEQELKEYEPHVQGVAGLFVPQTGIVDFIKVTETFASETKAMGHDVLTGCRFLNLQSNADGLILETNQGALHTKNLINCGGLQSDRMARKAGINPGVRIVPFRGEYYELIEDKHHLVKNLIYPVPDPAFPFLGVHFTRMIHGGVEAGPNAVLAFKREGYHKLSFSVQDTFETISYGGFWKLAGKYMRTGLGEFYRSFNKAAFVKALQKLIPEIQEEDIKPGGAGVRAQALDAHGNLVDDFHIVQNDRMIHVLNAPSPAATASISIGQQIADMAVQQFIID
ncbi:MAG: L-2-hydroxyglutarate oxidase [Caldithrix sp.]|nr:L-2-hydroxyglutarate oxidase [Caldithrix sp.]